MKETTKTEIVRWIVIFALVSYAIIVASTMAKDVEKTKEEKYFENKGCTLIEEKFKDKTLNETLKARVFEVTCNNQTWNVMVYKEKLK